MRTCICGTQVAVDEPLCPKCGKSVRSRGRFGFTTIVIRIVLCALLVVVITGYWWLLLEGPASLSAVRQAADEAAVVADLRSVSTAESLFRADKGRYGSLPELIAAGVLDTRFARNQTGYLLDIVASDSDYKARAYPTTMSEGRYAFYLRADGIIRYSDDPTLAPAGMAGKEIQ
jgi:hypothetical protein